MSPTYLSKDPHSKTELPTTGTVVKNSEGKCQATEFHFFYMYIHLATETLATSSKDIPQKQTVDTEEDLPHRGRCSVM